MTLPFDCAIIGSGGHARVLIDALRASGSPLRLAIFERNPVPPGAAVLGVPVVGDDAGLRDAARAGVRFFIVAVGGVGNNAPRADIFRRATALGLEALTVVHPSAIVSSFASVGRGAQLLAGSIIAAGASIGENVIVNSGAIVEHDCSIGDHVHVASGVVMGGSVTVGPLAHLGSGATIRQEINIGSRAVVGAGAVVIRDVPDDTVVVGVPAQPIRSAVPRD